MTGLVFQSTRTSLISSANPAVSGQPVAFTATIRIQGLGPGTPTGTVQFQVDGNNAGNPVPLNTSGGMTTASLSSTTLAVGTHAIVASYSGDNRFTGSSGTLPGGQTVNQASTNTVVVSSGSPSVFGQAVSFTAAISVQSPGAGTPTGTVQFQIDGHNAGSPVGVNTSGGVTIATYSSNTLAVGSHTVTAGYSGDGNFANSSGSLAGGQVVNRAASSTAVSSSVNVPVFGQTVTFTAIISITAPGAGTPSGTVQFQIDGNNAGSPVNVSTFGGVTTASFSNAALAVGTHSITASYSGDGNFTSSSATLTGGQAVSKASTSTALTSSTEPSLFGQSLTFTATISVTAPGTGMPTGAVQFQIDGTNAGSPVSVSTSGGVTTAFFSTAALAVGAHAITASYSGDDSFATSIGSVLGGQTVYKASTAVVVSSSVNPSVRGQSVTFTATINVMAPGSGTPSGTVQFQIDGSNAGNPVSIGITGGVITASLNTATLAVGTHILTASYSGDDSFFGSSGTYAGGQAVNKASTSTALASSANPTVFGQGVTFTATVTANSPGSGIPTGSVQFQIDGSNLGSPVNLSGGQATSVATSSLSVSGHAIKVVYSGDSDFTTSGGTLTQTVNQAATKTGIGSSVNASVYGQSVTFTTMVSVQSPGAGTPTGSVQFQIDGGNAGGPVNVSTTGGITTAAFRISGLTVGTHVVRANYGGDASFANSSGMLTQTVNQAITSTAVTSSLNPSFFGQTVTFTATVGVTAPGAGTPTGTVQFQIDGNNTGNPVSVATSGGLTTASFSTSTLTVATHTITANYNGDGSFTASNGTLAGGEVVKPIGVNAAQSSGVVSIVSDAGNNAITIKQISPGVLRVYGDPVPPPAIPTRVNGTDFADFNLASITGINIQFSSGNDKVTMTGFSIPGDISISAGSGADAFTLDTITALGISITATGADTVGVNNVTAKKDLSIIVGPGTQSVGVKKTTALDLTIQAHSRARDNAKFDLENDTITNANAGGLTLDDSHGAGNDAVILSHINIASQLAVTLGSGINFLDADHVTASFGFIDGGEPNSGANAFTDYGGNDGFFVFNFIGH